MDKKTQRKIQRDARKKARELKGCSNAEFNEFVDYLSQKEIAIGNNITKTNRQIQRLERRPRSRNVSEFGEMESTAVSAVATAGAVAVLSVLGGLDETTTFVTSGIGAVVGGGLGKVVAQVYNNKPISNAVTDIMLHIKRNKLANLTQAREESEYFLDALDSEMAK